MTKEKPQDKYSNSLKLNPIFARLSKAREITSNQGGTKEIVTTTRPPGIKQIPSVKSKTKLSSLIPRKAGDRGRRGGGRGFPTAKVSGSRPLTTYGFNRGQEDKVAPPSRGEELRRGNIKEGGRGFPVNSQVKVAQ